MKLKMLLHSSTSPLSSLLFIFTILLSGLAVAGPDNEDTPGIIESLERLIEIHRKEMNEVTFQIKSNPKIVASLPSVKEVKVDPYFMKSIIFYSDRKYFDLQKFNSCQFLSLLDSGLLKTINGPVTSLPSRVVFADKVESALLDKQDFIKIFTKNECQEFLEIHSAYQTRNLTATFKSLKLEVPRNETKCQEIFKSWQKNLATPYICSSLIAVNEGKIAEKQLLGTSLDNISERRKLESTITLANSLNTKMSPLQLAFFNGLCQEIDDEKKFCSRYQKDDIWNRVASREKAEYLIAYQCKDFLKRDQLSASDLMTCKDRAIANPSICQTSMISTYPSLFPHQDCIQIGKSLSSGKLVTEYNDCPGRSDNEGIINTHRLLMHFDKLKYNTTPLTCADEATTTFADLNLKFEGKKAWPLEICYPNPATQERECFSYVPGKGLDLENSELNIISKILYKMKGVSSDTKCVMTSSVEYNPNLLKYKNGCFVVFNPQKCSTLNCIKKIFYNLKEINGIEYQGTPHFDYFPTAFSNEYYSTRNLLKISRKIEMRTIKNLSDLRYYLGLSDNTIIHGIACLEDLLPTHRKKITLNQCSPTPFIIDGTFDEDDNSYVVTRLAAESVHHPRAINWQIIFSAISNYQKLHPLQTWTLYGARKN